MTTRAQFVAGVRVELQDPGPGYVWSDGLLQGFLAEALNRLTLDLPPTREATLPAVVGQRDYGLAGVVQVGPGGLLAVQYPAGFALPAGETSRQYPDGWSFGSGSGQPAGQPFGQCWEWLADSQTLRFRYGLPSAGTITARACGLYAPPAADADPLPVAVFDEVALKWYVCYRALAWLDEVRGKRALANVPGNRGAQGYYLRLYTAAVEGRKRTLRIGRLGTF